MLFPFRLGAGLVEVRRSYSRGILYVYALITTHDLGWVNSCGALASFTGLQIKREGLLLTVHFTHAQRLLDIFPVNFFIYLRKFS